MARPLRIEYPSAFYHVTARGNERRQIPEFGPGIRNSQNFQFIWVRVWLNDSL